MSTPEALKGLNCPRCGGTVPIPEGQAIVICPFCDLRSIVRGDAGIRRYQVPVRVDREQAEACLRKFLGGNIAISGAARREAVLTEVILVHLPFWAIWGRALGWVFGKKKVGSGKDSHYEPREVKVVQELTWNTAACEVGEFGVTQVNLSGRPLEPFQADALHHSGMVFEPTGSSLEALEQARQEFNNSVRSKASLDQVSQAFVRIVRQRRGLVYYPLWMVRYTFRGRSFQIAVDGFSGEVLYGKAPGNLLYRAAVLVGGIALGAFLSVDVAYLALTSSSDSEDSAFGFAIGAFVAGIAASIFSYRSYRYGEHYEYKRDKGGKAKSGGVLDESLGAAGKVLDKLEFFK